MAIAGGIVSQVENEVEKVRGDDVPSDSDEFSDEVRDIQLGSGFLGAVLL